MAIAINDGEVAVMDVDWLTIVSAVTAQRSSRNLNHQRSVVGVVKKDHSSLRRSLMRFSSLDSLSWYEWVGEEAAQGGAVGKCHSYGLYYFQDVCYVCPGKPKQHHQSLKT